MPLRRTFGRQQQAADAPNPDVSNSEILISGDIEKPTRPPGAPVTPANSAPPAPYSGLIMAHGNKTEGYGLYFMNDKMYFTVNQGGKAYEIITAQALPAKFSFKAGLLKDGTMRLLSIIKMPVQLKLLAYLKIQWTFL
jgi:hypothetical protein